MKNGAVLAGAIALAVSTGASAQSTTASGLLRQIGGALSGKSGSQAKVSHPLYAEPAGMYWDLDGDTLDGVQQLREGLSSTGAQGIDMCDMGLLAMAHSAYQLRPDKRQWCLRQAWVAAKRTTGSKEADGSVATRMRKDIHRALRGLAAVRRRATEWLRRVEAERRAASLLTRAEQSLEDFVEQQPRPTGAAMVAWARRRGRRLAAVEQRLEALRKARTKIEDGQEEACTDELSAAVAELEAGSKLALDRLEDPLHEREDTTVLTASMPKATPRPRLH